MTKVIRALLVFIMALTCLGFWLLWLDTPAQAAPADSSYQEKQGPASISDTFSLARTQHSLTPVGSSLYLFGGNTGISSSSELWRFDPATQKWTMLKNPVSGPPARQGHAATTFGNQLYIFGGEDGQGQKMDDIWRYNPATGNWQQVVQDSRPPARSGHTATAANNQFLVFGGKMTMPTQPNAVWVFDPATGYWTTRGLANPVGSRYGQSSGMLGNYWMFVGGEGTDNDTFLQAVNASTQLFHNVPVTATTRPAPRKNQATAFDDTNDTLFIFGGEDLGTGSTISDTWKFTLASGQWERMPDLPFPISGAQASVVTSTHSSPARGAFSGLVSGFKIIIAGGQNAQGELLTKPYVFDGIQYEPMDNIYSTYIPLVRR